MNMPLGSTSDQYEEWAAECNVSPVCGVRDWDGTGWKTCTNSPLQGGERCVHHLIEAQLEEMEYLAQKEDQTEADCIAFGHCQIELERLRRLA